MENIRGHHLDSKLLNADSVVIDLGACEGEFAREIEARWGARVFAIEANPANYARTFHGGRVTRHNVAISDRIGTAKLYLAQNQEGNSLNARHRDVSLEACVEIPCTTLKDFMAQNGIRKVDVLKVDIEGAEIALFASLSDDELRGFTQVSVEFHDFITALEIGGEVAAIKKRMKRLGFGWIIYRKPNVDVLFLNLNAPGVRVWNLRCHQFLTALLLEWRDAVGALKTVVKRALGRAG